MSEQSKDNLQAIGAGLGAFVVVVAFGAALLFKQHGAPAASSASIAPVEASVVGLPEPAVRHGAAFAERRQASPQPVVGGAADDVSDEQFAAAAGGSGAAANANAALAGGSSAHQQAASGAAALNGLGAPKHAGKGESASSARAEVKQVAAETKAEAAPAPKPMPRVKLDTSRNAVASSVHYGVTSRADVMGRAAGPVYNLSGRLPKDTKEAKTAQQAGAAAEEQLAKAQKTIDESGLPEAQKAELRRKLTDVNAAK